jgi:hypothetical protein
MFKEYKLYNDTNWLKFVKYSDDDMFHKMHQYLSAKDIKMAGWIMTQRLKSHGYIKL